MLIKLFLIGKRKNDWEYELDDWILHIVMLFS